MTHYGFKDMMAEANATIDTISVQEALDLVGDDGTVFVDVREAAEGETQGQIKDSVSAPRGLLEFIADPDGPFHNEVFASDKFFVVYCGTGGRSALATLTLNKMGLTNAASMAGGYAAWKEAGGPIED